MNQIQSLQRFKLPLFGGLFALVIGILVIIGWEIDVIVLKSVLPGFIAMKFNTAIGLVSFSLALLFLDTHLQKFKFSNSLAGALTLLGGAIGVASLIQYIFKINLGIDELFYADIEKSGLPYPAGRMAPITAINFILLSVGIFVGPLSKKPRFRLSQTLVFIVGLASFQTLIEYLLRIQTEFGSTTYTPIAIHTAACFVFLSGGLLSISPKRGLMRVFLNRDDSGKLASNLVLALIFIPPIFKFLILGGEQIGLFEADFSTLFRSILSITFFVVLVIRSVEGLHRSDLLRKRSVRNLQKKEKEREEIRSSLMVAEAVQSSEARLRMIFNSSFDGIIGFNTQCTITEWNSQCERIFGWKSEEVVGKNIFHCLYPTDQWEELSRNFHNMCSTYNFSIFQKPIEVETLTKSGKMISVRIGIAHMHISGELLFIGSVQDITEQKKLLEELLTSRELALTSTKSKSEFLANMSHEIRTPMNGVIGMATVLLDSNLNESQRESAKLIKQSAESLLNIIGGILDHSKIEAGKLNLEQHSFDITEVTKDVARILRIAADEKGISLKVNLSPLKSPYVIGDAGRVRQILVNFLSNAIKFTEVGEVVLKVICLESEKELTSLRFEVIDSGPGLSELDMTKLFQLYGQTEKGIKKGGTGLGLYISGQLIRLMNGRYGVQSQIGIGSTFWFEIDFKIGAKIKPAPVANQNFFLAGHILIVEDQPINQRVIGSYLAKLGISFDVAANGAIALQMIENSKYDLVLMDCRMPVMDGYETTAKIRKQEINTSQKIPIIALSAEISTDDRQRCLDLGMNEFLGKPIDFNKLANTLSMWLTEGRERSYVIDETALKKLSGYSSGEQSLVDALIEEFPKSASKVIDDMHLASQNADLKTISDLAHSLKSTSATLGLIRVVDMCQTIESLENIPANFISLVSRLEVEVLLAETDLSRLKSDFRR